MKVNHRVSLASNEEISAELSALGIDVAPSGFVFFDVGELHPDWDRIAAWIAERKPVDLVTTAFTKKEVAEASWNQLVTQWHCGYPQPDEDGFGFRSATYDLRDWCEHCGIGLRQPQAFQMSRAPKWSGRKITQLHWVGDEFFVEPEFWQQYLKPFGVRVRPVLGTDGRELGDVLQLVAAPEARIRGSGLAREQCGSCDREKYVRGLRGSFPRCARFPRVISVQRTSFSGAVQRRREPCSCRQSSRRSCNATCGERRCAPRRRRRGSAAADR